MKNNLISIRKHLHAHPELSGNEKNTAQFIVEELKKIGVDKIHEDFAQHSIIAVIKGEYDGQGVLFRSELDALPIQEQNDFEHKSKRKGVSHKCGHDGHSTILIGLAERLTANRPKKGTVYLLFQSAEETGAGARIIMQSKLLDKYAIDYVFSLHNVPGFKKSSVFCKSGIFTPTVESLEIELQGKTSHAGQPDKAINPALAIAAIVHFFQNLHEPDMNKKDYFVIAPIHIKMGEKAYGTTAGSAILGYTIRSNDIDQFKEKKELIIKQINTIATGHRLTAKINWLESFQSNTNDEEAVEIIQQATKDCSLAYNTIRVPFDWGEDFGLITQHYRGAMFGLGSGENTPPLHDELYDFPDDIISDGIALFYQISKYIQG